MRSVVRISLPGISTLVIALLLLVVLLLFTHTGNVFIWRQVTNIFPALQGELVEGQILTGWRFHNLQWQDPQISFRANDVTLQWQLNRIFERQLPISLVAIDKAHLTIQSTEVTQPTNTVTEKEQSTAEPSPPTINIPLDILIDKITVRDFQVTVPEAKVALATLEGQLQLQDNRLLIPEGRADNLHILLSEKPDTGTSAASTNAAHSTALGFSTIKLPEVNLPLPISLQRFVLTNAQFQQGGMVETLARLQLGLDWQTTQISNLQLSAEQTKANIQLAGAIDLSGDYPLNLEINGTILDDFGIAKLAAIKGETFTLKASGDLQKLTLDLVTKGAVNASLTGSIELLAPHLPYDLSWQGQLKLTELRIEQWLPDLAGILNGQLDTRFTLSRDIWQLNVPKLNITGSLMQKPVNVTGNLKVDNRVTEGAVLPVQLHVKGLDAKIGGNLLHVSGEVAEKLSLKANLNAKSLEQIIPAMQGSLHGDLQLTGNSKSPQLAFTITSPSVKYQQTAIAQLKANGSVTGQLTSNDSGVTGKTRVQIDALSHGDINLKQLLLTIRGNEQKHQISLTTKGEPVAGDVQLLGSWDKNKQAWQGQLTSAHIATPVDNWRLEKPLSIIFNSHGEVMLGNQCWVAQTTAKSAKLCLEPSQFSANRGSARFQLSNVNLASLKPFLPDQLNWQAILSGEGDVQWADGIPVANIRLQTTPGTITTSSNAAITLKYQKLATTLRLTQDDLVAQFNFQSQQLGNARINLTVDDLQNSRRLAGDAKLDGLNLQTMQPLIPDLETITGILVADTRIGGTLKAPLLFGRVALSGGQLVAQQEMVKVSDLVTVVDADGAKGTVSGGMKVGDGQLNLSGQLAWQNMPPTGVISIKGDNLGVNIPGIAQVKASPNLKFTIGQVQTLAGTIQIPRARISINQLPTQAIRPSADVVIILPNKVGKEETTPIPFSMNVNVVLGDDLKIAAYGLKADLTGHLLITLLPGTAISADGSIQLLNGKYRKFGQDLLIKEGNIIFSGPLSTPYIMLNAIRNPDNIEDDVTVGIRVDGEPSNPELKIYSDPAMSQEQQWSYLLQGKALQAGDSPSLQNVLLTVGISQVGGMVSYLGDSVGISDLSLGTSGSGDDTQITVGGNITPGLRIEYGAGVFNAISEMKVRYELIPRLYLQAVSGVNQAIDLLYQFDFDPSKPQ